MNEKRKLINKCAYFLIKKLVMFLSFSVIFPSYTDKCLVLMNSIIITLTSVFYFVFSSYTNTEKSDIESYYINWALAIIIHKGLISTTKCFEFRPVKAINKIWKSILTGDCSVHLDTIFQLDSHRLMRQLH